MLNTGLRLGDVRATWPQPPPAVSPSCAVCCLISSPVEKESTHRCNQHIHLLQRSATELACHLGMKKCLKRQYKTKYLEELKLLQKQKKFVKRRGTKQTRLLTSKARIIQFQCDTWVFHLVPTVSCLFTGHHQEEYNCLFTPFLSLPSAGYMALSRSPLPASRLNHLSSFQPQLLSASPHLSDASISWSASWPFTGPPTVCPCLYH